MIIGINAVNINSGGGVAHIENILTYLPQNFAKNNKIIVWINPKLFNYLKKYKIQNKNINIIKKKIIFFGFFWKFFFLYKELKKNNCDVLFSVDGLVLKKFKKTVILFQNLLPFCNHEIIKYGFSFNTFKLILLRYLYYISKNKSDGVIYLSSYSKLKIENQIGKAKKSIIIPHGVSKDFSSIKKNNIYNNKNINIIYVSNIDLYKYQWNVIEAVELLIKENFNVKLHLVGPVNNRTALNLLNKSSCKLNSFKKNSVIFYGELKRSELIKILTKMNFYIYASSCETFGITLLEGIASKLPVLSSNMSGLKKIFGDEYYISYFNPKNPTSIYRSLKKNFLSTDSPTINEKKLLKKFSWKQISAANVKFISDIYYDNRKN
jgi:glycosyltransferase involved in cell wall biosynthesis